MRCLGVRHSKKLASLKGNIAVGERKERDMQSTVGKVSIKLNISFSSVHGCRKCELRATRQYRGIRKLVRT